MKEFIEYLLKEMVTNPDEVRVEEEAQGDSFTYHIYAAKEDMGIIIGKEGRNIKSIRNIAKAKAIRENIFVRVILEESDEQQPEDEA